jgi:hypothetical protein
MERTTMTRINRDEYEQLQSFDQALVWALITLEKANKNPRNLELTEFVTIRADAKNFINSQVQLDATGQPYLTFSMLFPLSDHNPLQASPALPLKIPNYTDFQPEPELLTIPLIGQGLPLPAIPDEIDTLERLACWLGLIANQQAEFLDYLTGLQSLPGAYLPDYTIDIRGLTWDKPYSYSQVYGQRGIGGSSEGLTAGGAFDAFEGGDNSPSRPNNEYLSERIAEARDQQAAASEPPQVSPGKGYDRIDTLPVCKDQDPSIKAFNKPLKELLK